MNYCTNYSAHHNHSVITKKYGVGNIIESKKKNHGNIDLTKNY